MMTRYLMIALLVLFHPAHILAQGHIENIKNQSYLQYAKGIDCKGKIDNQLTSRICANLRFQTADSFLTVIYTRLLKIALKDKHQSRYRQLVNVQVSWRKLRDQHCAIVYEHFGKNAGSQQAIEYLDCLTEMTESRINELTWLYRNLAEL